MWTKFAVGVYTGLTYDLRVLRTAFHPFQLSLRTRRVPRNSRLQDHVPLQRGPVCVQRRIVHV